MTSDPRPITSQPDVLLLVLLVFPLVVSLAKLPIIPGAVAVSRFVSLADLPSDLRSIAEEIVFIPLGALVVVAFRLTLGLRVLGLFRPILLAYAFHAIGIPLGLGMLAPILLFVLLLRPLLASGHSYPPTAVLLSLVAVVLLAPLVVGTRWDLAWLQKLAHFPLIALCLTCESFAKTVRRDGIPEAVWRALTTVAAAIMITFLSRLAADTEVFLRFPELLLTQAGCVLLIKKHLDFRLCESLPRTTTVPGPIARTAPIQGDAG